MIKDKENLMPGMIKAAEMYGTVCSSRNCEDCAVGIVKGSGLTCAEFAKQFPKKFVSLLWDESQDGLTYAEEYQTRFPESDVNLEMLIAMGMCRKAIFEGDISCEIASEENCKQCWTTRYITDTEVDMTVQEEEDSGVHFEYGVE